MRPNLAHHPFVLLNFVSLNCLTLATLLAAVAILLLTGCGMGPRLIPSPAQGAALQGIVHGGQQPVAGSRIYLMAAGTSAYAGPSVSLLATATTDSIGSYVLSDAHGNFSISGDYTCTPGQQVYALAKGGDSGTGTNSGVGLIAVLGNCPLSGTFSGTVPFIEINEVSTVAAAFALAGYAYDSTHISSNGTPQALTGIANAFATASNLADLGTGTALALTPAGNGYPPNTTVNTLANILATCVNSADQSVAVPYSTNCYSLGQAASGGDPSIFHGHEDDVATVAIFIAQNPGANVAALYALSTPQGPFLPALTTQPNDFTLGIYYYGGGLDYAYAVALDASGNVWFASYYGTLSKFSPVGVPLSPSGGYTGGGLAGQPKGMAIDLNGNAWITNYANASISEFSNAGTPLSTSSGFTGNGLAYPSVPAVDLAGDLWVPGSAISFFNSSGVPATGSGITGGGVNAPTSVAIDSSGNLWVSNRAGNSLTKLSSSGSPISSSAGYTGGGLDYPYSVAIDSSGNVWASNRPANSVSKFSSSGSPISPSAGYTGGGLDGAYSLAIDGAGNVWASSYFANSVSEFSNSGTAISNASGFLGAGAFGYPYAIATDSAGNVWTTGYGTYVSELVGAAVPVETPLVQALQDSCLAQLPCPTPP
jgi:streptogramin lyase